MNSDNMPSAEKEDLSEQFTEVKPLRIMLLGKSGAGKSSSGNTILGRMVFESDMSLARVTKHCEKGVGKVGDVDVAVIDTPGFFETDRKKEEIVREILQSVKLQEPGPHVFVLVVPLGRMTQEDKDTYKLIENRFGPRVWDYTIVLFTHGDRLEGKTINNVITESEENLRSFIRKCSGGFHVFNNKDEQEDQEQVMRFIAKIQTLMALNAGGYYQTDMYPEEERKIRKRQESILTERNDEISRKERELEEHHKEEELEMKKKMLWRKEEKNARLAAEKATNNNLKLLVLVCMFLLGALLSLGIVWALPMMIILMCVYFYVFQTFSGKIPWMSGKKTE